MVATYHRWRGCSRCAITVAVRVAGIVTTTRGGGCCFRSRWFHVAGAIGVCHGAIAILIVRRLDFFH